MKKLRGFKTIDLQEVVNRLKIELRFIITNAELRSTFTDVFGEPPTVEIAREVRKMLDAERTNVMQSLCSQIGSKFDYAPKPRELKVILEASGYNYSRPFQEALLKMIHAQNAERWVAAVAIKARLKLTLHEGDKAMWDALQRSYDINAAGLASMLLRVFTVATNAGKIDFLEVPYLAATLTDKEMRMYADSINFTVKKPRKPRASKN